MSEGRMAPQELAEEGDASRACRELDRLQKLIKDAVPSLMRSFEKIAELSAAQNALLEASLTGSAAPGAAQDRVAEGGDPVRAEKLKLARAYDAHLQHHMQAAVISLQFEDMAVQLISHVRDRVGRMESEGGRPLKPDEEWKSRTFGPITAEGLNPGSVDLF